MPPTESLQHDLAAFVGQFFADPLGFVLACYPWGQPGELQHHDGPDIWQREFLEALGREVAARGFDGQHSVMPVRAAVSSGHGVGKSTIQAWLVDGLMSTRPYAKGTVTANTSTQLETKTWAAIQRWTRLCLTAPWFVVNTEKLYHRAFKDSWFCTAQTCREENSEAFAGQHAADASSFYINDEDSAVPDSIHTVEEGGLTDGEPFQFLFGNPTRNTGKFHEACFGRGRDRYLVRVVDARDSRFTNKQLIAEWLADYGDDSDFFRVRVRGLPPSAGDAQFIDSARVYAAQKRAVDVLRDQPLIAGVDVSGGGGAWTVCWFRRGFDGRTLPPIRLTGEQSRDRNRIVSVLAERLAQTGPDQQIAAMFVDSAFGAAVVERLHALGFSQVHEVNFGGESADVHQANQRAYQWNRLKDWLLHGAIPATDARLEGDLTAPGFHLNKKDQLVLESKESMQKRGVASPDDGDALSLTFARPVAVTLGHVPAPYRAKSAWG